jgi:hypothetical protein
MFGCRSAGRAVAGTTKGDVMAVLLIALLVVLILAGLGFVLHVLWWLAVIALVLWLLGFAFRSAGGRRGGWYRR